MVVYCPPFKQLLISMCVCMCVCWKSLRGLAPPLVEARGPSTCIGLSPDCINFNTGEFSLSPARDLKERRERVTKVKNNFCGRIYIL